MGPSLHVRIKCFSPIPLPLLHYVLHSSLDLVEFDLDKTPHLVNFDVHKTPHLVNFDVDETHDCVKFLCSPILCCIQVFKLVKFNCEQLLIQLSQLENKIRNGKIKSISELLPGKTSIKP